MKAEFYIEQLQLLKHPEGGYYRETYRSIETVKDGKFDGPRNVCTAIYFLITAGNFSAFHKIKSDEIWHFYAGDPLEVVEIDEQGQIIKTLIGNNLEAGEQFQYTVAANRWFGSRVSSEGSFSLVGCTVSPGFDFVDFEMAERHALLEAFPNQEKIIREMTR